MRVLVTGGGGFLGGHIADSLRSRGHEVRLFDSALANNEGQADGIAGDILDAGAVDAAVKDADVVYHLAAIADLDEAIRTPLRTIEVNVLGTANVLEACRRHGVKRFVFASTIYVFSEQGSFYRTSKRACENLIEDYREQFGLPYTILRFGSLYGPRADAHNPVYRIIQQALRDGRIDYHGTGEEMREYIHVQDAAESAVDILAPEFENQNISLTGTERMRTRDLLEMIREILGGKVELKFGTTTRTGHYMQTPYSYTPKIGRKLVRNTYVDIGLGLLECIRDVDHAMNGEGNAGGDGRPVNGEKK